MTRDELARLLSRSRSMIPKYVLQGMPVLTGGGRGKQSEYLPSACVAWFAAQIEARFAGTEELNPAQERARRDRAQAELARQLHERRAGQVLDRDEVLQALRIVVVGTRARILAVPRAAAERLAETTTPAQAEAILTAELRSALTDLANFRLEPATPVSSAEASERNGGPAT